MERISYITFPFVFEEEKQSSENALDLPRFDMHGFRTIPRPSFLLILPNDGFGLKSTRRYAQSSSESRVNALENAFAYVRFINNVRVAQIFSDH